MNTARCFWPIEDDQLHLSDAIDQAYLQLPDIFAENWWLAAGQPRNWRIEEGVDGFGAPALFLVCEVDVYLRLPEDRNHVTPSLQGVPA